MARDETSAESVEFVVAEDQAGTRLDVVLAAQLSDHSRAALRRVIDAQQVTVDGQPAKPSQRLRPGQKIALRLPPLPRPGPEPEDIPLDILFEDEHFAAINKPAGMIVHPAKGHWSGTLASAAAFHFEGLSSTAGPARPGIVHRLDRDTSGVVVVAKTDAAHLHLAAQFEQRTVEKEYTVLVAGLPDHDRDWIDAPIGADPSHRERMAVRRDHATSREAKTFYEVAERFEGFALLRVLPKTGRTHQIRVHLKHIGCPVLCDRLYGGRAKITRGEISRSEDATVLLDRQALHARRLKLVHPTTGQEMEFVAPLPDDIERVLQVLREERSR